MHGKALLRVLEKDEQIEALKSKVAEMDQRIRAQKQTQLGR